MELPCYFAPKMAKRCNGDIQAYKNIKEEKT